MIKPLNLTVTLPLNAEGKTPEPWRRAGDGARTQQAARTLEAADVAEVGGHEEARCGRPVVPICSEPEPPMQHSSQQQWVRRGGFSGFGRKRTETKHTTNLCRGRD